MIAELEMLSREADALYLRLVRAWYRDPSPRLAHLRGRATERAKRRYEAWQSALDRQAEDATVGLAEFMMENPHDG